MAGEAKLCPKIMISFLVLEDWYIILNANKGHSQTGNDQNQPM